MIKTTNLHFLQQSPHELKQSLPPFKQTLVLIILQNGIRFILQ